MIFCNIYGWTSGDLSQLLYGHQALQLINQIRTQSELTSSSGSWKRKSCLAKTVGQTNDWSNVFLDDYQHIWPLHVLYCMISFQGGLEEGIWNLEHTCILRLHIILDSWIPLNFHLQKIHNAPSAKAKQNQPTNQPDHRPPIFPKFATWLWASLSYLLEVRKKKVNPRVVRFGIQWNHETWRFQQLCNPWCISKNGWIWTHRVC